MNWTYLDDPIVCENCGVVVEEHSGYTGVQYGICEDCEKRVIAMRAEYAKALRYAAFPVVLNMGGAIMTTRNDIDAIRRMLDRKQTVPTSMIRSIVSVCENLLKIIELQNREIQNLKAEAREEETQS